MSLQHEPLKMNQSTTSDKKKDVNSHTEEPPKLEFARPNESLEALGAALGGAVLGVLATLLILAILNNGTLIFNSAGSETLRANLTRIDENLGAVSHNVDVVSERLAALEGEEGAIGQLQGSLTTLDASLVALDEEVSRQGVVMEELEVTRRNFDTFTAALAEALSNMGATEAETESAPAAQAPATVEPTVESPAAAATTDNEAVGEAAVVPVVTTDASLAADTVVAYLFVDSNNDGMMNAEEASLLGATVALTPPDGEPITGQTTDTGVLFEELAPGDYTVTIEDALGFTLAGDSNVTITVAEDAEEGQAIYFPVEADE
jgi:hypothetical protein